MFLSQFKINQREVALGKYTTLLLTAYSLQALIQKARQVVGRPNRSFEKQLSLLRLAQVN